MDGKERGSAELAKRRFEQGISVDYIDKLSDLLQQDDWDIWIKGQPPRITDVLGTVRVDRSRLGEVVQSLIDLEELDLDVLIRGQPPRWRAIDVQFQTPGQR